jgi:hypothetical protein
MTNGETLISAFAFSNKSDIEMRAPLNAASLSTLGALFIFLPRLQFAYLCGMHLTKKG